MEDLTESLLGNLPCQVLAWAKPDPAFLTPDQTVAPLQEPVAGTGTSSVMQPR